jgi:hypothetical protein
LTFLAALFAYFHIGPWAVEPPQDVIGPYENALAGYTAFAIAMALICSIIVGAVYAVILSRREG